MVPLALITQVFPSDRNQGKYLGGHQYYQCLSTGSGSRSCCIRDKSFSQLCSTFHSRDHSRLTWCVAGSTDERCTIREGSNLLGPATGYWDSTIFCFFEETPQCVRSSVYTVSNCVTGKSLFTLC